MRHRGIEIDQTKIDAIMKMPEPRNIHELRKVGLSPTIHSQSSQPLSAIQSSDEEGDSIRMG